MFLSFVHIITLSWYEYADYTVALVPLESIDDDNQDGARARVQQMDEVATRLKEKQQSLNALADTIVNRRESLAKAQVNKGCHTKHKTHTCLPLYRKENAATVAAPCPVIDFFRRYQRLLLLPLIPFLSAKLSSF